MNRNMVIVVIIVVVVLAVGGFVFFGKKTGNNVNPLSNKTSPTPVSLHSAVSDVTVTATEFAFSPQTIPAVAGKPLTITFKNNGKYPHNMTFKELNVATKTLQPGQSETIKITPPKAGMFRFSCTVDSHASKGMFGVLMIQPQGTAAPIKLK